MIAGQHDLVVSPRTARFRGRVFPCRVGRSGLAANKREGDGATPVGRFRAEYALFRPDRISPFRTCLRLLPTRLGDGWSDDPVDPAYNQPIRLPADRCGCESMRLSRGLYDLVVVLDFNRSPVRPGRGSAIFLHVADLLGRPTAGCVALRRRDLLYVLRNWQLRSRVVIGGRAAAMPGLPTPAAVADGTVVTSP